MKSSVFDFVHIVADTLPVPEPIYEFGSFLVDSTANLRPLFPDKIYFGCDMRLGPGVDKILNLHDINLPSSSIATALILETLEHTEFPHRAIDEIFRILVPDGYVVISSQMEMAIHSHPNDYWRFTPEAFKSLLRSFNKVLVYSCGDPLFPHTVVGIGFKGSIPSLDKFNSRAKAWQKRWEYPKGIRPFIHYCLPRLLVHLYRKWKLRKKSTR